MNKARKILFGGAVYGLLALGGLLISNQRAAAVVACSEYAVSQSDFMDCNCRGARGTVKDTALGGGSHMLEVELLQRTSIRSSIWGWGWPDGRTIQDQTINDGSVALLQAQNYDWIGCVVEADIILE